MDKKFAFNSVKELLAKNGVEFKADFPIEMIMVKVGRISHFMHFTERSFAIISSVKVGKKDIETTHLDRWYEDIAGFRFLEGQLWIDDNTLGYIVLNCKQG